MQMRRPRCLFTQLGRCKPLGQDLVGRREAENADFYGPHGTEGFIVFRYSASGRSDRAVVVDADEVHASRAGDQALAVGGDAGRASIRARRPPPVVSRSTKRQS